jgi:carbonic anhydrase/acetyltransferase-like protein (isoleucine patch superfamily)
MPIYALGDLVPEIDPEAYVHPDAVVIGRVILAEQASVWPAAVLRGDHGAIRVGARTSVQDGTVVHCTAQEDTVIGADCVVGHNAHLEGCVVEDGCLIGSGSVVLNRARVGAGSIVAAAALVAEDFVVPAASLIAGVPGKVKRTGIDASWTKGAVQTYIHTSSQHRSGLRRIGLRPLWGARIHHPSGATKGPIERKP